MAWVEFTTCKNSQREWTETLQDVRHWSTISGRLRYSNWQRSARNYPGVDARTYFVEKDIHKYFFVTWILGQTWTLYRVTYKWSAKLQKTVVRVKIERTFWISFFQNFFVYQWTIFFTTWFLYLKFFNRSFLKSVNMSS